MSTFVKFALRGAGTYGELQSDPFERWVSKSPDAALQWALALPLEKPYSARFLSIAMEPFASDPARVLTLLPKLEDPDARESLVDSAADAWIQRDPAAAWAWSAQLTEPSLREAFEKKFSDQWAALDPDTAIPWLSKNHPYYLQSVHLSSLQTWAETVPDAALAMVGQLPVDDAYEKIVSNLLEGIGVTKPIPALSQLDLLQDTPQRKVLVQIVMSDWSGRDITAASAYTDALPPGEDRQAAIRGIVAAAFWQSPESALSWSLTLTNPEEKSRKIGEFFKNWQEKDPTAAQNWLEHAPLDDALRQKLTPSQP